MMEPFQHKVMPTMEYLILLGLTVAFVLVALESGHLPKSRDEADSFFGKATADIMDKRPAYVNFAPRK